MNMSSAHEVEASFLAEIIRARLDDFLVVDCRNFVDYNTSHIQAAINAFYSKIIRRRLLNSKNCVETVISHLSRGIGDPLASHFNQTTLVLYDDNGGEAHDKSAHFCNFRFASTASSSSSSSSCLPTRIALRRCASEETSAANLLDSNHFIRVLLEKLQQSKHFAKVLVLKGGFLEFRKRFPDLCESASLNNNNRSTGDDSFAQQIAPLINTTHESSVRRDNPQQQVVNPNRFAQHQHPFPSKDMKTAMMSTSLSHPIGLSNRLVATSDCGGSSSSLPPTQITQILDFVYVGSQEDAQSPAVLKRHGITKVINLSADCPKSDLIPQEHFLRIPIKDSYDAKIHCYFDDAYEFIEEARRANQKVLVHCLAGISRSPTLAIAYVMRSKALTCDEAYKFVKARRPSVSPNLNFMGQLFLYESQLRAKKILPPALRPRSNIIEDYNPPPPAEDLPHTQMSPPVPPPLVNETLCKSMSADFTQLIGGRESSPSESRKRVMGMPLSLPSRPRQLMKSGACCCRRSDGQQPATPQIPSPSSEFSKLDISLSNPCFNTPTSADPTPTRIPPTQPPSTGPPAAVEQPRISSVENPVFGLMSMSAGAGKSKSTARKVSPPGGKKGGSPLGSCGRKSPPSHHSHYHHIAHAYSRCRKLPLYERFSSHLDWMRKLSARDGGAASLRCIEKIVVSSNSSPPSARKLRSRFGLSTRTPISVLPTVQDHHEHEEEDDVDSGKASSISQSVSTEDSEPATNEDESTTPVRSPSTAVHSSSSSAGSPPFIRRDPERESISSASSLEIAVQ